MCLFDLVKQDNGERLAANALGELAALFEPDISGRGAKQTRRCVLLAIFGHVERNQRVLVVEQEFGKSFREFRLSHSGRSSKDERPGWTLRVFEPGARSADGLGQNRDGFFLTDDALVQRLLHHEKTCAFLFGQFEHGNAGGLSENFGDDSLIDGSEFTLVALAPFLLEAKALTEQLLFLIARLRCAFEVLILDGLFLFGANDSNLVVEFAKLRR